MFMTSYYLNTLVILDVRESMCFAKGCNFNEFILFKDIGNFGWERETIKGSVFLRRGGGILVNSYYLKTSVIFDVEGDNERACVSMGGG